MKKLTVSIVTWNSAKYIQKCLECLQSQSYKDFDIMVIDNNSTDNTIEIVKKTNPNSLIIENPNNLGFCGGHNLGIRSAKSTYYMPYNPDIFAEENYISEMIKAIELDEKIGAVSGKLLRIDPISFEKNNIIDSTGIKFKKNRRSIDRGSEEKDEGQYQRLQYVFGASGAAPLYRMTMLEDIKINNQYFLEYFFAYREDVDLAWRAQHREWSCLYTPYAIAYHVRTNTPKKRGQMSDAVNMHSVKNRMLLLLQNETKYGLVKDGILFMGYESLIFSYTLLRERSSLKAYAFIIKNIKYIIKTRQAILQSSKADKKKLLKWFGRLDHKDFNQI